MSGGEKSIRKRKLKMGSEGLLRVLLYWNLGICETTNRNMRTGKASREDVVMYILVKGSCIPDVSKYFVSSESNGLSSPG